MRQIISTFLLLFSLTISGVCQVTRTPSSSELLNELRKLRVMGSVLYIAAHPDDENTRLLSWLANEKCYRTAYLSLTRGDGGQNLIGGEQGVELGLIRTQELLAARKIDGAEQYFTRAYDFGYSKTPEETFRFWDKRKILYDVVWVIRQFRPDVIITRFPTTGEGGHGHHTASALLAAEAFDAAGDPDFFPEQFELGVSVWRPKRLLWNTFNFGTANTQKEDQFKVDVGEYNPLIGKSYGEIAAASRSQHKSQGFGVPSQRGSILEYFETLKGSKPSTTLLEEVDTTWSRAGMPLMDAEISRIMASMDMLHPELSLGDLTKLYARIQNAGFDPVWKKYKLKHLRELILQCAGIYLEASAGVPYAVRGDSIKLTATVNSRLATPADSVRLTMMGKSFNMPVLKKNQNAAVVASFFMDDSMPLSQPYWLELPMKEGCFELTDPRLTGKPETEPLKAVFQISIQGLVLEYDRPIHYKHTDPVRGEIFDPLIVTDPVSIKSKETLQLMRNGKASDGTAELRAFRAFREGPDQDGKSKIENRIDIAARDSIHLAAGEKKLFKVPLKAPGIWQLGCVDKGRWLGREWRRIEYDHIPAISYHKPAETTVLDVDLKTSGTRIGYIEGAGDKVPDALRQMGYEVEMLDESAMMPGKLKRYDAIVTGVRAYNTREWLYEHFKLLMEYVSQGGTLLTQYNTSNFISSTKSNFGPLPFVISRNRITDEVSPVEFLQPDHLVLQYPNKIGKKDFEGWVQERSIYHADKIDSGYSRILSFRDPGESAQEGSLIVTKWGKGRFVYTGLSFFRQLPAGVPGAYRLFANLLAREDAQTSAKKN
jgi:LmbE family N-acetylglucosaminyl deacetylase